MRVLLYHNQSAGNGDIPADKVLTALRRAGHDAVYREKKRGPVDESDLKDVELVVVAGGDGTVKSAVERFHHAVRDFAILPLGTANNIARALGIRGTVADLVPRLADAPTRSLNVGHVDVAGEAAPFVEGVGAGPLAQAMTQTHRRDIPSARKSEFARRVLAMLLDRAVPLDLRLTADGHEIGGDALMVEVLNTPFVGPNLCPAPDADPGDDRLAVAILRPEQRDAALRALEAGESRVPLEVIPAARVEMDLANAALRIDDDFFDPRQALRTLTLALEPDALRIAVPAAKDEP